jgi:hypothetical protein
VRAEQGFPCWHVRLFRPPPTPLRSTACVWPHCLSSLQINEPHLAHHALPLSEVYLVAPSTDFTLQTSHRGYYVGITYPELWQKTPERPDIQSLCVDAACDGAILFVCLVPMRVTGFRSRNSCFICINGGRAGAIL